MTQYPRYPRLPPTITTAARVDKCGSGSCYCPFFDIMDHDYTLHNPKKRRYTQTEARRYWNSHRNKTRINIGVAFPKWRELREKLGLDRDSALACVLIDSFIKGGPSTTSTPCKRPGMPLQTLSTIASSSDTPSEREHCFLEPGIERLSMKESDEEVLRERIKTSPGHIIVKMAYIKEESEDVKIEVKTEETFNQPEEQTDLVMLKEENEMLNEVEEKPIFLTEEQSTKTEETSQRSDPESESNFICDQCGKILNSKQCLEDHKSVHAEEKPFSCHLCGKSFARERSLKPHMKVHNGEKPFTCEQCGKTFSQAQNLKVHMRVHTGEKPFSCEQCGKSFSQMQNLEGHMRVHTGMMPYTCPQCGQCFTHKGNLNAHVRIHTGEKPFSCQQCGKSFTQKRNLVVHMRLHTGEKPYTCTQCEQSFRHKTSLNDHMRIHTGEKPCLQRDQKSFADS